MELVFFDRVEDPRPARAIPLDPVANRTYHYWHGFVPGLRAAGAMKSVVVDPGAYDWEGDAPLRRPAARTIVYEMHVRRFTRHPSSRVILPRGVRLVGREERHRGVAAPTTTAAGTAVWKARPMTPPWSGCATAR